jgi:hypothetical protein
MTRSLPNLPRLAAATLAATLAAGCTINWGEGGITDAKVAGRPVADLGPSATNADAAAPAKVDKDDDGEKSSLRKVAVLPVAYTDGTKTLACDLCGADVAMKPTSAKAARLVTGFVYEAVARHPRLLFPPPEVVDRAMAGRSMKEAAAQLHASGKADLVVVTALVELRPRIGPDDAPEKRAGVALHAALVDAASGKVLWSKSFDEDESSRGMVLRTYDALMNDAPVRYATAEAFSEYAVDDLIEDLIDEID